MLAIDDALEYATLFEGFIILRYMHSQLQQSKDKFDNEKYEIFMKIFVRE